MLDTFILTPSMRLFVPGFQAEPPHPQTCLEPSVTFLTNLSSNLTRFTALPTRFTGLPDWAFPKHGAARVPLYTRLRPRYTALGSQRSPRSCLGVRSTAPLFSLARPAIPRFDHSSCSPKGQFTSSVLLTGPCYSSLSSAPLSSESPNHIITPAIRGNGGHSELRSALTGFATTEGHSVRV